MQTLIIPEIEKFMKNKNLLIHKAFGETTGFLLVTVHCKNVSYIKGICSGQNSKPHNMGYIRTKIYPVTGQ